MGPGSGSGAEHLLLSTAPVRRGDVLLAAGTLVALAAACAATAPFARIALPGTEPLLPAYAAAVFVAETVTATLLLGLFAVERWWAILALASGYLFSSLMVVPWALTFPGVFPSFGLDGSLQGTATIAAARRLGFPLFVIAYALGRRRGTALRGPTAGGRLVLLVVVGVAAAVAATLWVVAASEVALPPFMRDRAHPALLWLAVPTLSLVLYGVAAVALAARGLSVLDLWLLVVLATLGTELVLISFIGGGQRLGVGWWAGRLYGLAAASVVLVVLLLATTTLYARLARALVMERRARQNRLTAMEALSASIAHEINQPLASMVTNATAGLRWLDRDRADEVRAALERIARDGHRAGQIVEGIRRLFRTGVDAYREVHLVPLFAAVLERAAGELDMARIVVRIAVAPGTPPVLADAVQLELVLANLVSNAADAMRDAGTRVLSIDGRGHGAHEVEICVADSGPGLPPGATEAIFRPFFTTKSDGMGMGLMFCRSIVEAHGGRLWVETGDGGAVFRFTLPAAGGEAA